MRYVLFTFLYLISINLQGQDVMMQAWYWDYPKTADGENWTDTLNNQAVELANVGFTHLWLPPLTRSSFGSGSNGYDPQDLYDLGEYGGGATGFGTRAQVDNLISTLSTNGIETVADVVYNHRDGGKAENNPSVEGWMENLNCTKINAGDQPFPSDRVRFVLPIGGSTGNGAGNYYIKIASASKHPNFYDLGYKFYIQTNTTGFQNLPALNESETNGGGDCGQGNNSVPLGVDMLATIDNDGACGSGCGVDEFAIAVSASDFNSAGDSLFIYMNNTGGYSDHFIYGIYHDFAGTDVQGQLIYQTYTDFTAMPSGAGAMNYQNFKPNGNPTNLGGDWDSPLFFYDYDQNVSSTNQALVDWTQWLWDDVDVRGLRMDAVKHFDPAFVGNLLDSLHVQGQDPSMVVGEFFDFNAGALKGWVDNVNSNMEATTQANIDVKVFDFALRESLKNACDAFGYDARNVFQTGVVDNAGANSSSVVTFVNNHDFRGVDEPIQNDPLLPYAYILTNRSVGTPTVFYPDYYDLSIPNSPQQLLKTDIDRMIESYNSFIDGADYDYINDFGSSDVIAYHQGFETTSLIYQTIDGGISGVFDAIVLINFAGDTLDVEFNTSSLSSKPPNTTWQETTGKGLIPMTESTASNTIRLAVPPRSYGIWVSTDVNSNCIADSIVYVDVNATGLNNGSSWEDAFSDLGAAIAQSGFCTDIDEIWIKEGTYKSNILDDRAIPFLIGDGLTVRGGFPTSESPTIGDYDPSANPVILSGDIGSSGIGTDNSYSVIRTAPGDTIKIIGINIQDGNANGSISSQQSGGGINSIFNLKLIDCTITNCQAMTSGNALYIGANSSVSLENCTIELNSGSSTEIMVDTNAKLSSIGSNTVKD